MRSRSLALVTLSALLALPAAASAKCGWTIASSPDPANNNSLGFVSGSSASDVWGIGYTASPSGLYSTLGIHWNGTSWTTTATQNPGIQDILRGVADVSPTDAWAVGVEFLPSGGNQGRSSSGTERRGTS